MFNSFINELSQDLSELSQNPVLKAKYIGSSDESVRPFKTGWKRGVELGQSHITSNLKHQKIKLQNAVYLALIYKSKEIVCRLHYDLVAIIKQFDCITIRLATTGYVSDSNEREYSLSRYLLRTLDKEITSIYRSIHNAECDRFAIVNALQEIAFVPSEKIAHATLEDGYLAGLSACNTALNSRFIASKDKLQSYFCQQQAKHSHTPLSLEQIELLLAISSHIESEQLSCKAITETDFFSNYVLDLIKPQNTNTGTFLSLLINEAQESSDGLITSWSVVGKIYDQLSSSQKADLIFKLANLRTKLN
ncbi:hypothetical protein [Photobacterium leiognathi]|uniref:hypothetical protein n=1 Tax=Photobacterium leiognathi TaxID=553611 RepID=UPI00298152CE|nr:hypothetical protein [Photobacterium leiognathi]